MKLSRPQRFSFKQMGSLSRFFEENGYALIEDFISLEQCQALKNQAKQLVDHFRLSHQDGGFSKRGEAYAKTNYLLQLPKKLHFFFEDEAFSPQEELLYPVECSINKISYALHDLDAVFREFSNGPEVIKILDNLGKREAQIIQSMYIFKQAYIGGQVAFHQDATYLHATPNPVFGLWIALEDATSDNGCLQILPGEHRQPLRSLLRRTSAGVKMETYNPIPWQKGQAIAVEVRAGSAILLHGLLPHGSDPNRSAVTRQAYSLHFIEKNCDFLESNWLQRD